MVVPQQWPEFDLRTDNVIFLKAMQRPLTLMFIAGFSSAYCLCENASSLLTWPGVELDNIQYISQITKFSKQLQTT